MNNDEKLKEKAHLQLPSGPLQVKLMASDIGDPGDNSTGRETQAVRAERQCGRRR